jgi:very-short-patch-repair endonuclease
VDLLQIQCKALKLPIPETEHRFCTRRWRFDYAFIKAKLAVEIEGGIFIRGRHSRGKGMLADMDKYNSATIYGWSILRFVPDQVEKGTAALTIKQWFEARQ